MMNRSSPECNYLVQTPRVRVGTLPGTSAFITKRLNQLHVGEAAASGELGEHGGKCSKIELKVQQLLPTNNH